MKKYVEYLISLLTHKWWVLIAGRKLGLPFWRLIIHDWQKFTPSEFVNYARWFKGDRTNDDGRRFMYAWNHHIHHGGQHHWEYWLIHPGYNFKLATNGMIPMPETYVLEMVADWLAASKTYTGSWIMSDWLNENGPKMYLHDDTSTLLWNVLVDRLGYFITDNCDWSWLGCYDAHKADTKGKLYVR